MIETKTGLKIRALQIDNGREYLSTSFTDYLRTNGINHRLICPHTHQQNGSVERKHRHITETGLALLAQASLPLHFWDEAFLTATYLINRLPSPVTQLKSPYEILNHHKPDYTFLKCFGCTCYPLLRPYNQHKLDFKSHKCVFIGYANNQKGYKCLSPTGQVYISRNVIFNETEFPYSQLFPNTEFTSKHKPSSSTTTSCMPNFPLIHPPTQDHSSSLIPVSTESNPALVSHESPSPSSIPPVSNAIDVSCSTTPTSAFPIENSPPLSSTQSAGSYETIDIAVQLPLAAAPDPGPSVLSKP